jgi:hypothetical protein
MLQIMKTKGQEATVPKMCYGVGGSSRNEPSMELLFFLIMNDLNDFWLTPPLGAIIRNIVSISYIFSFRIALVLL